MAVNIVTGMTGIEHITSHDDRARNASQFGRGKYVFNIGRKFSATAVDDNLVRIQDGMCINQGTQMGIEPNDYADVEIDNGLLGTNRHDIIVMRYEKNEETLLEKASLAVVKGVNSSEPVDPDITEGNILDGGDLVDDMPLYRVIIEGVNLVSVEPLFEVFDGDVGSILEELEDKVDKVTGKGLSTNDYTNEDKAKVDDIPTKTSDLENDSDFVSDENYIHTDNNYTNEDKEDVKKIDDIENISVLPTSTVYEVTSIALYGGGMVEALNNESAISVSVGDYIYAKNDISKKFNFGYEATKTLKAGYYRVKSVYSNGHAVICAINSSTVPDSTYGIVTITELEKSLAIEKMDIDGKVDKVDGKGLSTNDYTDADKEDVAKIDDIEHSLSLTSTATGNPISISDSAHVNAEELTVELEPKQDLHGYDNPWVGGAGKNLLQVTATTGTSNGINFTVNNDGSVLANGTATATVVFVLGNLSLTGTSLILNGCPIGGGASTYKLQAWNNDESGAAGQDFGEGVTFTPSVAFSVRIVIYSGQTLTNLLLKPMIRLATETDPTFEPYSNICPISGYDETSVVRSGKNLFGVKLSEVKQKNTSASWNNNVATINGVTFTFTTDQNDYVTNITYSGTCTDNVYFVLTDNFAPPEGTYNNFNGNDFIVQTSLWFTNTTFVATSGFIANVFIYCRDGGAYNGNINPMIYSVDYDDSTYEPYIADTYTLQFGETVYGAEVDFVSGVARVKMIQSVITGGVERGNVGANGLYIGIVAVNAKPSANNSAGNIISDKLQTVTADYQWVDTNNSVSINGLGYVQVCIENITSNSDLNTYLASNPVQICYELATPYTIQLTPQQIKMLKGNNVLVADGDMELTYQLDSVVGDVKEWAENEFLPKSLATAQHNYSTQEQVVGTWIDGSTLYEKTLHFTGTYTGAQSLTIGVSNLDIVIPFIAFAVDNYDSIVPLPYVNGTAELDPKGGWLVNSSKEYINIRFGSSFVANELWFTIQYTKTVD